MPGSVREELSVREAANALSCSCGPCLRYPLTVPRKPAVTSNGDALDADSKSAAHVPASSMRRHTS